MLSETAKSLIKIEIKHLHCCILIYQVSHLITEGYEVSEAKFHLHKSMVTTPGDLVFHVFGNGFQEDFLCCPPRDGCEAVAPWILLIAALSQELLLAYQGASKIIKSGLTMTSASSLSTHGYIPSGHMDLFMSSLGIP